MRAVAGQYGLDEWDVLGLVEVHLDTLATDLALQLSGRAARDDLTVIHDGDIVGKLVGLLEVLRREQQRGQQRRRLCL